MRRMLMLISASLLPAVAVAGVYKWVDADGTVHYGDTPKPGAEEVYVPPAQTYTPAPLPAFTPTPEPTEAVAEYTQFDIATPAADASLWDNTGTLAVSFNLVPALNTGQGHQLVVLLDGKAQAPVQGTGTSLENVERGSHTLQGQVIDAEGKVLISSPTITVHMHRQSVLGPNRARPPAP